MVTISARVMKSCAQATARAAARLPSQAITMEALTPAMSWMAALGGGARLLEAQLSAGGRPVLRHGGYGGASG